LLALLQKNCSLKREKKEKGEQSHTYGSSATFCECIRLYTVTVQVTASVSPEIMLVAEKVFSKTMVPLEAFVNTPDACTLVKVPLAVNVFANVYVDVAALSESLVGVNVPKALCRPFVVISPLSVHADEPLAQSATAGVMSVVVRAIWLASVEHNVLLLDIEHMSQSIPPAVIRL